MLEHPKVFVPSREHEDWLVRHDRHVDRKWVAQCLHQGKYVLAIAHGNPIGFLRFSWFWGKIPYMEMIEVVEDQRHMGVGTKMLNHWEGLMKKAGATILMTSAVSDEPGPYEWHKRHGFIDSGVLTFGSFQHTPEKFLIKSLST